LDEPLGLLAHRVGGHGLLDRCIGELGLLAFCLSLGECRFGDSSFETNFNFAGEEDER
jgi:hypothetical protein